jgi:hypothetical protein
MTDSKNLRGNDRPKLSDNAGFSWFAFDAIAWLTSLTVQRMSAAERGVYITLLATQWHDNYLPSTEQLLSKRTGFEVRLLHRWLGNHGHLFPICTANPQYRANQKLWNLAVTVGKIIPPEPLKQTTETTPNESETTTIPPSAGSSSSPTPNGLRDGKLQPQAVPAANGEVPAALGGNAVNGPADPRQWNRDVAGVPADRIRSCVRFQLDHRRNSWYVDNITESTLGKEAFVRKLDADTPQGWSPEKPDSPRSTLPLELQQWASAIQENANEC